MSSGMTERRLVFRDDCFARGLFFGRSVDNGRNTEKGKTKKPTVKNGGKKGDGKRWFRQRKYVT